MIPRIVLPQKPQKMMPSHPSFSCLAPGGTPHNQPVGGSKWSSWELEAGLPMLELNVRIDELDLRGCEDGRSRRVDGRRSGIVTGAAPLGEVLAGQC